MSKLQNWWKVLAFGTVAAVFGLMMASCAEDPGDETEPEDKGPYTVTIRGGGDGYFAFNYSDDYPAPTTRFYTGDTVVVYAGEQLGKEFSAWTFNPATINSFDPTDVTDVFIMPSSNVTVTATWDAAEVRFAWETAQQPNIDMIMVDSVMVDWWYHAVYDQYDDPSLSTSHMPRYDGSPMLPKDLYTSVSAGGSGSTVNKNKYFPIAMGNYTAICTVVDRTFDDPDTFDIVANYGITLGTGGKTSYRTIGFDVGLFIDLENTPGADDPDNWITDTDDGTAPGGPPYLNKKRPAKFLKKVQKDDVTYYVFRRAHK